MNRFQRERRTMGKMLSLRVAEEQTETLGKLADALGMRTIADVMRAALDYYCEKSPEARAALKKLER